MNVRMSLVINHNSIFRNRHINAKLLIFLNKCDIMSTVNCVGNGANMTKKMTSKSKSGTVKCMIDSFKKSTTEMLVLSLLSRKPMYVYEIVKELDEKTQGLFHITTLYPAIYRLVEFGFAKEFACCVSEDNRLRKYYSITEEGRGHLLYMQSEYHKLTGAVEMITNETDQTQESEEKDHIREKSNPKRSQSVS